MTFSLLFQVLCRWLLTVRKNYRNVIYHNWRHAFNVAQSMFCMLVVCNYVNRRVIFDVAMLIERSSNEFRVFFELT